MIIKSFSQVTIKKWLKVALILVPILFLTAALNGNFLLTSSVGYQYHPSQKTGIIIPTSPTSIVQTANKKTPWRLLSNAFPFSLHLPRLIPTVRIQARLPITTQPAVYFTATGTSTRGNITTLAYSSFLNDLGWNHLTAGGLTLWQRPDKPTATTETVNGKEKKIPARPVKQFSSIDAFRADPPNLKKVATVGLDRMALADGFDYTPSNTPITLNHTLRGTQRIYLYAGRETISVSFAMADMNREKGSDGLVARLIRADAFTDGHHNWLVTKKIKDDGVTKVTKIRSDARQVTLTYPNPTPGVFLLEINTSNDILISNLTTNQRRFAFDQKLFLADGPAYTLNEDFTPATVRTNGSSLAFMPLHNEGKQTFFWQRKKYQIRKIAEPVTLANLKQDIDVTITNGDISITSDGFITLAPAELLPLKGADGIAVYPAPNIDKYDYILAEYTLPAKPGMVMIDETYAIDDLQVSSKKDLSFSFSFPGLRENDYVVGLKDIKATLYRGPFPWAKIWNKITHLKI